jgi:hypothetical protein
MVSGKITIRSDNHYVVVGKGWWDIGNLSRNFHLGLNNWTFLQINDISQTEISFFNLTAPTRFFQ